MDLREFLAENGMTVAIGVVLVIVVGGAIKMLMPKKKVFAEGMTLNVRCRSCSWQGTVTKYNQVCRKCNGSDLEQL